MRDILAPADPPISPPVRLASAYGHGAAFIAVRYIIFIQSHC